MTLQNRVQPGGEILAHPARGGFMGNRGILHDAHQHLTRARWRHKAWVCCVLAFKGRHRQVMTPGRYTELFFHDEAVALAAGHRPCAECRRADYNAFKEAAGISGKIGSFDDLLHAERAVPRVWQQRRHVAAIEELPDGAFIQLADGRAAMVHKDALLPFAPAGYGAPLKRPNSGSVTLLTPPVLVEALRAGYKPQLALD